MPQADPVNQLLGTLYAAPMAPELWGLFLQGLAELVEVSKAGLLSHDLEHGKHQALALYGDDMEEVGRLYNDQWGHLDEWFARGLHRVERSGPGRLRLGVEVWPQNEMPGHPFYEDFLKKYDVQHMSAVVTVSSSVLTEHLSLYRGAREEAFEVRSMREQMEILQAVIPHLQIALLTRRKLLALEERVSDLEDALDCVSSALVLLDGKGRCILANRAARAILDQRSGLSLERSLLAARGAGESARLREAIAVAIATGEGKCTRAAGAVTVSRPGRRPLHVVVAPFRSEGPSLGHSLGGAMPRRTAAIVFLHDPEEKASLPSETLRLLFGLTPAEARLALAMLDGRSLAEAADLHRVGRETVRSQMKSVFQKTGTRRQAELVRLLAGLTGGHEGRG
jgi:DNA-binding CsgD family transcriptional regulator/PAS domain-containing protein